LLLIFFLILIFLLLFLSIALRHGRARARLGLGRRLRAGSGVRAGFAGLVAGSRAGRQEAPLIPKLRGYVAEFLHERSLERLRIFISPTCVGFSTVTLFVRRRLFLAPLGRTSGSYMPSSLRNANFCPRAPSPRSVLTPSTAKSGAGILTCCPSTTPLGLVLGPD
jgi:hypothetical protein